MTKHLRYLHQISNRSAYVSNKIRNGRNGSETYESVPEFYAGKSVFITGGTGYLGKVFIEKLLYSCPNINKLFVLIREKNHDYVHQRIQCMVENQVSVVFHSAATTKMNETLKIALNINLEGTQNVLNLCQRMKQLKAFVHISTAYTNTDKKIIDEVVYPPPAELNEVYDFVEKYGNNEKKTLMFLNGRPNTYTFTKALAENYVLENHGNIPTVIIRPSIIGPAVNEPDKGWVDNWFGGTALLSYTGKGYCRALHGLNDNIMDVIPVDYVSNLTLVAAAKCNNSDKVTVLNCCSSSSNPITIKEVFSTYASECVKLGLNDLYPGVIFSNRRWLVSLITLSTLTVPAYIADIYLLIRGKAKRYIKISSKVQNLHRVLEYFMANSWVMKSSGVRALYNSMSPSDQKLFPFDITNLAWTKYINTYVKGVHKYLINKLR